jgi:hypothetical protein
MNRTATWQFVFQRMARPVFVLRLADASERRGAVREQVVRIGPLRCPRPTQAG